ncbi:hypothetical protein TrVGV298_009328 [Trichoderma virens]|nr:hypothetical protein TrVGV298_009328 [Trichoderma virens]
MWFLPCGLNGSTILVGRGTARALSFAGRRPPHSRDLERLPAAGQGALVAACATPSMLSTAGPTTLNY